MLKPRDFFAETPARDQSNVTINPFDSEAKKHLHDYDMRVCPCWLFKRNTPRVRSRPGIRRWGHTHWSLMRSYGFRKVMTAIYNVHSLWILVSLQVPKGQVFLEIG